MPRPQLTTTQRGLGYTHQADRRRLLAELRPGEPCLQRFRDGTICGKPMWPSQELDRGHIIDRALGGANGPAILVHASCNRIAGAQLGNAMQAAGLVPRGIPKSIRPCPACGKITDRGARPCEICGAHCHPSHSFNRTCSRKCGARLKQRNQMANGWTPPALRPKPQPYAGPVASGQRAPRNGWPVTAVTYYTCRYCGELKTARQTGQPREVCPDRACQLARLEANRQRSEQRLATASREW